LSRPLYALLSSVSHSVFCIGFVVSHHVSREHPLTHLGQGHHFVCFTCLAVNLGQRPNISREILRLLFTPLWSPFFDPSEGNWEAAVIFLFQNVASVNSDRHLSFMWHLVNLTNFYLTSGGNSKLIQPIKKFVVLYLHVCTIKQNLASN
jgi:hypothetical protein